MSHIKRSRAPVCPVPCDNFLYQGLQGRAERAVWRVVPARQRARAGEVTSGALGGGGRKRRGTLAATGLAAPP